MDSAVSEASTMLFVSDRYNPALGVEALAVPQQQHRQHKPVKRQASELGLHSSNKIQAQTADVWAQQQMNWVQMWPESGFQHAAQHPMPWMTAAGHRDMSGQQLLAQSMSAAMHMQSHADLSAASMLSNGYGHGPDLGTVPHAALGLEPAAAAAAAMVPAADVTAVAPMPAPQHRLPKRRASAPHLMPAATQQQLVFKCVPHVGGPDCPCTTCLCARTDELCQRIVQQRSAQAANTASAGAYQSSRASNAAPMQPRASSQQRQGQAAGLGQSPVSGKRRSFELPHAPKSRRSPDGRQSIDSPANAAAAVYTRQQPAGGGSVFTGYAASCSPPLQQYSPPAAAGQCILTPAGSGPLRGQFQALSVSAAPFDSAPEAYVAANAAAAQAGLERSMAAGPGLPKVSSGHSGVGYEDEAAIDLELEQMLAQIAWPGQHSTSAQQHGRPQHMHHRSLPHTLQDVHVDEALQHQMTAQQAIAPRLSSDAYARAAAAVSGPQGMPQRQAPPQQQHHQLQYQAGAYAGRSTAVPACPAMAGSLQAWNVERSGPSFDHWGSCHVGDPDELLVGCAGSPDLALLGDLLADHPEEASLVDLLLN